MNTKVLNNFFVSKYVKNEFAHKICDCSSECLCVIHIRVPKTSTTQSNLHVLELSHVKDYVGHFSLITSLTILRGQDKYIFCML